MTKTKGELKLGLATREAFGKALAELGHENPNIVVCDADLSKSTYTNLFANDFPDRFFECGIAEANMVGIGSGLASSGGTRTLMATVLPNTESRPRYTLAIPPEAMRDSTRYRPPSVLCSSAMGSGNTTRDGGDGVEEGRSRPGNGVSRGRPRRP